ncbi:MAG: hypothetical protein IJK81_00510 [Selenomonadaceae bacterium]|nr:hypothetical protein [Selenomonadaceae bacterium]
MRVEVLAPKPKKVKPFKPPRYRTCVVCGKPFLLTPKKLRNQHRTCSKECHDKVCAPPIPEKICPICGKKFKGIHSWQKTCSPECGAKFNGLNQRGEKVERVTSICIWCGKPFRHKITEAKKLCSRECADTFRALTQRKGLKSNQEIRTCACCGKSFVATKNCRKNYCSAECREKLKQRTCAICGKVFTARTKNQRTCSFVCGQVLRLQTRQLTRQS